MLVVGHTRGLGKQIFDLWGTMGISSADIDLRHPNFKLTNFGREKDMVYNAGLGYDDLITNLHLNKLTDMINVNLVSAMMMTKQFIRHLLRNDYKGTITFISSISGQTGFKGLSMYGATKAGLEGLARGVAVEWVSRGIRCNCVAPGFMETDMTAKLTDKQKARIKHWTDPDDVIGAIEFILNTNITGQTITI